WLRARRALGACVRDRCLPPSWPAYFRCALATATCISRASTHAGIRGSAGGDSVNGMDDSASMHILVVDDEAPLRDTLTRSFSKEGHTVEAVSSGTEAIEHASAEQFDVILLDVALGA